MKATIQINSSKEMKIIDPEKGCIYFNNRSKLHYILIDNNFGYGHDFVKFYCIERNISDSYPITMLEQCEIFHGTITLTQ
jgi:hypothetical protein